MQPSNPQSPETLTRTQLKEGTTALIEDQAIELFKQCKLFMDLERSALQEKLSKYNIDHAKEGQSTLLNEDVLQTMSDVFDVLVYYACQRISIEKTLSEYKNFVRVTKNENEKISISLILLLEDVYLTSCLLAIKETSQFSEHFSSENEKLQNVRAYKFLGPIIKAVANTMRSNDTPAFINNLGAGIDVMFDCAF